MAANAVVLRAFGSPGTASFSYAARLPDNAQQSSTLTFSSFGSISLSSGIQQLQAQSPIVFRMDRDLAHNRVAGCPRAVATTEGASAGAKAIDSDSGTESTDGTQFLRPHLLSLAPYTPIEPFEVRLLKSLEPSDRSSMLRSFCIFCLSDVALLEAVNNLQKTLVLLPCHVAVQHLTTLAATDR
jgi:hypothetical protein